MALIVIDGSKQGEDPLTQLKKTANVAIFDAEKTVLGIQTMILANADARYFTSWVCERAERYMISYRNCCQLQVSALLHLIIVCCCLWSHHNRTVVQLIKSTKAIHAALAPIPNRI